MRQLQRLLIIPVIIPAMAAGLMACTTISPEQRAEACASTDWERYGVNDGTLGVTTASRADEFQDCAAVGQPVDLAAYQAGRSEGLAKYCTAENGYQVGYNGRKYRNVCPPTLESDFLQGYEQGRKERPALALHPNFGIVIGSGGSVRTGIGIGIGLGTRFGCSHTARCW